MERTTIYSWRLGIVAILVAAVALVTVMSACSNNADSEAMSAMNASISSQNAEIEALAAQVSDLQSELATVTAASSAASSETAALQAAIDGMKMEMNDDDDEPAEDYSDDIRSLESDISDLSEMIAENTDSIDALPNAMSAIASTILSEHADEHDGLEAAIQKAFDEHGVAHGQLEDAIEEAVIDLMADIAEGKEEEGETAGLLERFDWLEQAVAPAITQAYVDEAIRYYQANGRQATIDYYNSMESVKDDLYLFVLDEDYKIRVQPVVPANIGMDIRGPLGTDITGKNYGPEFVTVDERGKWVDYVYLNPADGFGYERKHTWTVRHDGLIFASGWYERDVALDKNPAAYTRALVHQAVARYDGNGRDATIDYYNSPESVDGQYYVFIGDENDMMIAHAPVPANVGKHFNDVISPDGYPAGAQVAAAAVEGGAWTTYTYLNASTGNVETKHSWVTRHNGMIFGSGWYEEGPSKSDAAAYAQSLVQRAVNLYDDLGRDGTVDYYNKPESVDGPWYVFILRENDLRTLANGARPELVDIDPPARIDAAGYAYGEAFAATTDEGHWVSYVFINPATDEFESKHTWIMEHDGLLFGSGWYAEPAAYTQYLVNEAISMYESEGREATVAYYNSRDNIDGQWYVFIGDENDVMLAHAPVPENVGKHFDEIISPDGYPAGAQAAAAAVEGGAWTTYTYLNAVSGNAETKHSWMVRHDGLIFGSGWYEEGPPKSDAAAYAQSLVQRATHLYDDLGREAAITYYNSPESLDGEWYTFVLDAGDFRSLANAARPELVGNIPERIDVTGYNYGAEFATVTEDGKWVSYVFKNPAKNDELAQKSTWLVKRGDLIFGAGYYE